MINPFFFQVQLKKIEPREKEFDQEQGPILITMVKPQIIREGDSATFSAQYSAAPAPEVKWYREGREIESSNDFQVKKRLKTMMFLWLFYK